MALCRSQDCRSDGSTFREQALKNNCSFDWLLLIYELVGQNHRQNSEIANLLTLMTLTSDNVHTLTEVKSRFEKIKNICICFANISHFVTVYFSENKGDCDIVTNFKHAIEIRNY